MAADSAVMVIDSAKGIEDQTRKLFHVCKMRNNKLDKEVLIDISDIEELKEIKEKGKTIKIGACTTFKDIINSDIISRNLSGLKKSSSLVGSPQIRSRGNIGGNNKISIKDIANKSVVGYESERLVGFGSHGSEYSPPPFIAGFAEVEIDTDTCKVKVINFVSVIDCGTVINKNLATIQAEGGIVQGIGMALYEDVIYDNKGKMITNTFMQYKIPSRCDIGNVIVDFEESYEPTGPFGAKSIGEVVINTPCPAISDAIYNGIGVRVNSLPITPEKIFMAYKNK